MFRNEEYRFGLTVFAASLLASAVAVLVIWLRTTPVDFREAWASWNCQVTQNRGGAIIEWYCMPGALRLAALSLWCSSLCLGGVIVIRFLSADWHLGRGCFVLMIRMVFAPLMAGALVFLEFYVIEYVLPYRPGETLVFHVWTGIALSAAIVSKSLFPKVNPLWLTIPIGLASIFGFVMNAVMLGIVFDV